MNQLIDPQIPYKKRADSVAAPRVEALPQKNQRASKGRRWVRMAIICVVAVVLVAFGLVVARAYALTSKVFVSKTSFFQKAHDLIFGASTSSANGGATGTVTVLLLGYGGQGHDGPYLTDSMILAKIDLSTKTVYLTSIPRDLYYESQDGEKINSVFSEGFDGVNGHTQDFAYGGDQAKAAISTLAGEPVDYFASADFEGFVDAVNQVGGLDIDVADTFTDDQYPDDANNGFLPPVTFVAGEQHMDGARALIYARSRHSLDNNEGSDFARSKRQQLVLQAFKTKTLQGNLFQNASEINSLLGTLASHFHTDMDPAEMLTIAKTLDSPSTQVVSESLDQDSGYVCPEILPTDGAYVLNPCPGITSTQIQDYIQNGFAQAGVRTENASVIMENTGTNSALYTQVMGELKDAGVTVYEVPYRGGIDLPVSQLYTIDSSAPKTESYIESLLKIQAQPKPPEMTAKSDLVLLIGDQ